MEYIIASAHHPRFNRSYRLARRAVTHLSVKTLAFAALAGVVAQQVSQRVLDRFYARSGYPVAYYAGQLSFSATKLERYYTTMRERGTLEVYVQTQIVDFAFIAATALAFVGSLLLVARAFPAGHRGRRFMTVLVPLALVAPVFDSLENLISFVMLRNPASISPPVAVAYSTMAAVKFAGFAAVYAAIMVGLVSAAVCRLRLTR
jgi:hypothetical protein